MILEGLILKGIGGFYYVETTDSIKTGIGKSIYECRARGKFRLDGITPLAGDKVSIDAMEDMTGFVIDVFERKNYLVRPPVANIDNLFIICSLENPAPDTLIIDKTIAAAVQKDITPIVVITKADIESKAKTAKRLMEIYKKAGIVCYCVSGITGEGTDEIKKLMQGKISALTGNSGAGKSTLLNALFPDFKLKTGEVSQKLGRGRHTTREVELYKIGDSAYVADTPGFSSFAIERYEMTDKDEIIYGFTDMMKYFGKCKFVSCSHTCEKGCAIIEAVKNGEISESRFESYVAMYNEVKDIKQWQLHKNV